MIDLTVCVTTFNRWEGCRRALLALVAQRDVGLELVLVDDASTDAIPEDFPRFIEANNVKFIQHSSNRGLAAARNTALGAATGQYFSFCDDDDTWPADLACQLLTSVSNAPDEVKMALAAPEHYSVTAEELVGSYPRLKTLMRKGFTPPVGSQIYETALLKEIGGYNENVRSGVDHDLWISLAERDPRTAISWGQTALVCSDPNAERITTNEERRRTRIKESLVIWRPKIITAFGAGFYEHFCGCYLDYLDYSFFLKSLHRKDVLETFRRLLSWNVSRTLVDRVWQKVSGRRRYNLFSEYRDS